ncbi:PPE family protein [Mycobacteroides abscessus subsp. abscessus]|uniref:PPE domain-containing protein n=1 Tax=Mycobacteroides abscessus TaxID=36809 RepID=UPI000929DD3D|nr:PPE domain-containing protein [Mycobacteroides abscessus]SHU25333.1 PPE family protein [Mycobacteroides abscessus subsp. abscessus]
MDVDPATLHSTAAALQSVAAPTPAPSAAAPMSTHAVSVAAIAQFNAHAANVAAVLDHAIALAQRAAATYTVSAHDFTQADERYSVGIANALNGMTDALTGSTTAALDVPAAPVSPPIPPHPPQPASLPHPPDPMASPESAEISAATLRSGDQGASLQTEAAAWRARATALSQYQNALERAASGLEQGWKGPAADSALGRLRPFAAWYGQAAKAAEGVAAHADQLVNAHNQVLSEHPPLEKVTALRQNYETAMAQAATGNAAAAQQAASYRQQWNEAQTQATNAVQSYATHSRVPAALPPVPPSPVTPGEGDVAGDKPAKGRGKASPEKKNEKPKTAGDTEFDKEPLQAFKPKPGTTAASEGHEAAANQIKQAPASPLKAPDAPSIDDVTPPAAALGNFPQQAAQMASGMNPQPPQAPQVPQMPPMPSSPPQVPQMPSSPPGGNPSGLPTAPMSPASAGGPISPIGGTGPAMGGGGGAGGGGGPSLAGTPGLTAPASALPASGAAGAHVSSGPQPGLNAGMPMGGMAPPGSGSGKEKERNADLAPDETVYVEDREYTSAFINGTIGPQPPADDKEQQR